MWPSRAAPKRASSPPNEYGPATGNTPVAETGGGGGGTSTVSRLRPDARAVRRNALPGPALADPQALDALARARELDRHAHARQRVVDAERERRRLARLEHAGH